MAAEVSTGKLETQPWNKSDWRNLLLILIAYAIAITLMPISHNFAYNND